MVPNAEIDPQMDRLKRMFADQDICEESEKLFRPFMIPQEVAGDSYLSTDSDDLEKVTSQLQKEKGRPPKPIVRTTNGDIEIPPCKLKTGELANIDVSFCHLEALLRFPYDFLGAAHRSKVVRSFFAKGEIFERTWDFFYLYPPINISRRPILLVPTIQVEYFLSQINEKLHMSLAMPDEESTSNFFVEFAADGNPRPRYLGRSTEREMAEGLKQAVPSASYRLDDESGCEDYPTEASQEAYRRKFELILQGAIRKKAASKAKREAERSIRQQSWWQSLELVQRYLGVRESQNDRANQHAAVKNAVKESEWTDYDEAVKEAIAKLPGSQKFSTDRPAPYPQEGCVVFVSVDIEAFEHNHNLVTEIGIATLDTFDIASTPPGINGTAWNSAITARHFRVREYGHLENKDFLQGCAGFFQFGQSEWLSIKDAPREVAKCFKPPFSKIEDEAEAASDTPHDNRVEEYANLVSKRNIVLVGHDVGTDINYLKQLGYDVRNLSNLHELVDTSNMYRALHQQQNPTNLGSILADLGISGSHLHNAGNDAVYTLQAMIGIALRAMQERDDAKIGEEKDKVPLSVSVRR